MHSQTTSGGLAAARQLLRERFAYPDFRPGQTEAVESVLAGRDTLVILPTGGGKSLCYQVPALVLDGLTVVISPLISLMKDQVDALVARGIPATFINSTLTQAEVSSRMAAVQRGEVKLLYLAPERFDVGRMADRLREIGVTLLAIDEAHCISEWGHDFRPSYLRVKDVRKRLGNPPTVALTATATPEVREDIARQLELRDPTVVITGFDRTNLSYHVIPAKNDAAKDETLVELLREHLSMHGEGVAIVYASTRKTVERIAQLLTKAKLPALGYHAGLDDEHRADVQDAFMSERVRVIVATNAFGMGIDKPNVRLVVHYAMPGTLEAYYQEAGRAGRDRAPATAVLLHAFPDRFTHEFFIKGALPERETVSAVYDALVKLADRAGLVEAGAPQLAATARGKVSDREAESAMRILQRGGALAVADASRTMAQVRLLAAPERIKAELSEDAHGLELALLRALWKRAGAALHTGIVANLDAMPPGIGGAMGAVPLLDALQARQMLVWKRLGEGLTLTDPKRPLKDWPVDWAGLDRRRQGELRKLEAVQQYAYTKYCRRGFVLRYFGDPAAKPRCDNCDVCLGIKHEQRVAAAPSARSRSARGSKAAGSAKLGASAGRGGATDAPLSRDDMARFDALKAMRSRLAKAEEVPAYVIFPDRALRGIAVANPESLAQLERVSGVGPARLDRYGREVLECLRDQRTL
ncbi:ATP-dependent DNA helicase [Pseudogemmatithrix spongiicola]|uniref:ATP-dependent DNA helicase RecQ n=1 Tax=Pseudogemmatithrix spongiicola TaxID=3062599 RepID=A0AA49JUL1_9BACT|nr:ATP-dependent DNA helicase [Gemmatimonadaceae bacterium 'strain 138']WKW15187.1 ATP-dependent DNA helicase [Gemmatimonadaceae bacterium 'strain 318']